MKFTEALTYATAFVTAVWMIVAIVVVVIFLYDVHVVLGLAFTSLILILVVGAIIYVLENEEDY
jgi:hypothetical protein